MRFYFENCGSALIKDFYCDIPDQIQNKKSISAGTFASWFLCSGLSEFNDENHGDLTKGDKNS